MLMAISQITGIVGWLLLVYSYYKDELEKLLFIQILSSIMYSVSYFVLFAWSGLLVNLFELAKEIGYYKTDKDKYIFALTLPVYFIIGYFTVDSWIAVLPIIGSIIDGFTLTKSKNIATFGGVISNVIWTVYDVCILAYACALTDAIVAFSNLSILLVGYSYLLKTNRLRVNKVSRLSYKHLKSINKIDKEVYDKKYLWDNNYQRELFEINKDSIILIKDKETTIGYINYLCINEDGYNKIINSKKPTLKYDLDYVTNFKRTKNYFLIDAIALKKKYQNYNAIKLINRTINSLVKYEYRHNHPIEAILFLSVSDFEQEITDSNLFTLIKEYQTHEKLFVIDKATIKNEFITKKFKEKEKLKDFKIIKNEQVTSELLDKVYELDKYFFNKDYLWTPEYQKEVFNQNKNSFVMITKNDELIGYINYLCINQEKYIDIKISDTIVDEYTLEDIQKYKKNSYNYITINSIVIKKEYQDTEVIKLLIKYFIKNLKDLEKNGYKIYGISTSAISKDGRKFAENLGFVKHKNLDKNNVLYILERSNLKKLIK